MIKFMGYGLTLLFFAAAGTCGVLYADDSTVPLYLIGAIALGIIGLMVWVITHKAVKNRKPAVTYYESQEGESLRHRNNYSR